VKYKADVFAVLTVLLLLLGAGYAQQNQTNTNPDDQQVASEKAQPPKAVHRQMPIYPQEAKGKRLQATVVVEAVVDKQGNVSSARMISGLKIFEDASLTAIKAWKFSPATLEGHPVEQKTQIRFEFRDYNPEASAFAK